MQPFNRHWQGWIRKGIFPPKFSGNPVGLQSFLHNQRSREKVLLRIWTALTFPDASLMVGKLRCWSDEGALGEPKDNKVCVYLGIAQTAIGPPLSRFFRHFVAHIFQWKWENWPNIGIVWYCMALHGIALHHMISVLHAIALYRMVFHGIACYFMVLHLSTLK